MFNKFFKKKFANDEILGEAKIVNSAVLANVADKIEEASIEDSLDNAGYPTDVYDTFFSRPADKINIPEITSSKATFVYNYFTRDERVRNSTTVQKDRIIGLDASKTADIFHRIKNKKVPRYVKLEISPPKIKNTLINDKPFNSLDINLAEIVDKIIVEGASSSQVFTGIELIDTGKESKIYSMLKGVSFFKEIQTGKLSQKEAAEKLHDTLREKGGLDGGDKKLIVESMTDLISEGYTLAPSDVSPEIANFASDPLAKQSFSVQFNNLLMADLIANSIIVPDNVYQDEVRSLNTFARKIKSEIIASIPPPETYKEADYDLQVDAISQKSINGPESFIREYKKQFPDIKFLGYLIEKYEMLPDETVSFLGRLFIEGHNSTYAVDNNVRYGGVYFYKIRTLCQVKTIASSENINDASLNQNVLATMVMASEGSLTTIQCLEKVPPPEPIAMRATFDFAVLKPRISWQFPLNKQRDIKRFQIFKRFSLDSPFTLMKEYNFDDSIIKGGVSEIAPEENLEVLNKPVLSFVDTTHNEGEKPIYAIACVDAHGMSSNYGPQLQVSRDRYTNRITRKIISKAGAPKPYPNLFINVDAFEDCIKASGYDRIKIFLDPDHYKVMKYEKVNNQLTTLAQDSVKELDLGLLAIDRNKFRYTLHMINVDNQKDETVKIKLQNFASVNGIDENFFEVSAENFSSKNVSFQYGVE